MTILSSDFIAGMSYIYIFGATALYQRKTLLYFCKKTENQSLYTQKSLLRIFIGIYWYNQYSLPRIFIDVIKKLLHFWNNGDL